MRTSEIIAFLLSSKFFPKYHLGGQKMTIIAVVLAGMVWSATMMYTGYMLRRLDEEVEKAEVRAQILAALNKKESNDSES